MRQGPQRKVAQLFSRFVKDILVVLTGTIVSFGFVHVITLQVIRHYQGILATERFYHAYFAFQMIPAAVAFAFLVSIIYYLYRKTRKMMLTLGEQELRARQEEAMVMTLQRITALMASSVARHNTEIMEWAASRREKGQEPPRKVTEASHRIARALQALSQLSFIMPYRAEESAGLADYAELLEKRLQAISASPVALLEQRNDR
jgi:glutathione S-transferase